MKRFIAVLTAVVIVFAALPALAAGEVYSVSAHYSESVYHKNLAELRLTGNQRLDLINVALTQVGYHEGDGVWQLDGSNASGSNNYTEYGYWYGMNVLGRGAGFFYEWCAMFTAWSARQARIPTDIINNAAYAHAGTNPYHFHMKYYPRGYYDPRPGDLIFYDWAYNDRNWDHVGIVLYSERGKIYTVEGNFSDRVIMREVSAYDREIQGYGAPQYTNALAMAVNVSSYRVPEAALEYGAEGDGVRWLQSALLHLGYPCPIDGHFGVNTLRQLKRFQLLCGLPVTGICADKTKAMINVKLSDGPVTSDDPSSYPVPTRTLRVGHMGEDVKWLQAALNKLGERVVVDGDFGNLTATKVIRVQERFGLMPDGVVGPATRERIRSAIGTAPAQPQPQSALSDPASYPCPVRTLKIGDSGEDVKWVQAVLTKKGMTMNMTGYFGEKTRNYVMAVQRYYNLTVDGIVGPQTLARLKVLLNSEGGTLTPSGANSQNYPLPTRNLRLGNTGEDVKWLQYALRKIGWTVSVDGIFGPNTEAKLRAFQRSIGINPDGICGPVTRIALKNRI